jgi:DNA-binding SARP family transcriptional activator
VLEIGLLGPLEVRDGERVLTPQRQKQRALLGVLALNPGRAVSADRLVDDLWGERAPKTAKHAIENYVSDLRKSLGRDSIRTDPAGYVLHVEPEKVDVVRFERLLAEARGGTAEERSRRLRAALALFRGPPLADLAFEPFAHIEVARITELELRAHEELADAELERGNHADVVATLEFLVAEHPFREGLRARLMVALYRSGRQAEALAAYQEARRVLVEELGLEPGVELQELERAILRQDPDLLPRPLEPAASPAQPPVPSQPLRKTVTVLFAELANAEALAERLDPEPLRAVLDRYRELVLASVDRYGGLAKQLAGDTAFAVFGVPAVHEDDALRAVRAAVELREGVGVLNDGLLPEAGVFLELRIGLSTGEVLADPGADDVATGHAVEVAERLEREAKAGQIILGVRTFELVRNLVDVEAVPADAATTRERAFRLVELHADPFGRTLRLDSPLVGRRRELAVLASAFEGVVTGHVFHLFTVLGDPGVGKSRLVREFLGASGNLARVLQGRCLPYGETLPFWPLVDALRPTGMVDDGESATYGEAMLRALGSLACERPLTLVLDDLQWAQAELLDFVERLPESLGRAPILLLCVARPELLDTRPSWGGGTANASSLLLEPLNEAESERLLDNLLGESDLTGPVRDHIIRSSDGNPLFVEELLAALVDQDILRRESGRWTTTEIAAIPMPPTIQALVGARIDRLAREERTVVGLASVVGKVFERAVVAELASPMLETDVAPQLDELVRKELVRPLEAPETFAFRHQAIRDVAYGSLPMRRRAELHELLADLLAARSTSRELSDYHREQARRYRRALATDPGPRA